MEFLEQVFPNLVALQFALLVFDTRDFRVHHQLHVELDALDADFLDGRPALQAPDPGQRGIDPVLQGRREPAFGTATVVEAYSTVAGVAVTTAPAHDAAGFKGILDGLATVLQFGGKDDAVFCVNKRQPGHFRAGVELDRQRLDDCLRFGFLEDQREGVTTISIGTLWIGGSD